MMPVLQCLASSFPASVLSSFVTVKTFWLLLFFLCSILEVAHTHTDPRSDGFVPAIKTLVAIKSWSKLQAQKYYPTQGENGELGDAYRHVLASVASRKMVGRSLASSAGWVNELVRDVAGSNTPHDRFMDLHNNKIGRVTYYTSLRAARLDSMALRVKRFIENDAHRKVLPWGTEAPIRREAMSVNRDPDYRAVYFVYE